MDGWTIEAWAFFPNHYHLIATHEVPDASLARTVARGHALAAKAANRADGLVGRTVWYRY